MNKYAPPFFAVYEIDHTNKYKVFNITNGTGEFICRVSGMGDELPHKQLRTLLVGQKFRHKELFYERVL